jgi:outer membrane immunogenic protein
MKKIAILAAALAAASSAASAADLPSRRPPAPVVAPVMAAPLWNGFYIGLNLGYGWATSSAVNAWEMNVATGGFGNFALANANNGGGVFGGLQLGYNWQAASNFVLGLEADLQGTGLRSRSAAVGIGAPWTSFYGSETKVDFYGTLRGRLGFLVTPTLLTYVTGGLAYGSGKFNTSYASTDGFFGANSQSFSRAGWTLGGGVEYAFSPNWSAKVEYGYVDLGRVTGTGLELRSVRGATWFYTQERKVAFHTVRAGLNYRFNWGAGPVVAKY